MKYARSTVTPFNEFIICIAQFFDGKQSCKWTSRFAFIRNLIVIKRSALKISD